MMTFEEITKDEEIREYVKYADECLKNKGFTEHSFAHVTKVASNVEYILSSLGYDEDTIEIAKIASFMHDIGNSVNRAHHNQSGAILARQLLRDRGFDVHTTIRIMNAIGNHDESDGAPSEPISAALILADKADIRRSRVRNQSVNKFDVHDLVNYSAMKTEFIVDGDNKIIKLTIILDSNYSNTIDYFNIFLNRMNMCKAAADKLGCKFILDISEQAV